MSIFKEMANTFKNIFNSDDDMIFDDDSDFENGNMQLPKLPLGKKKTDNMINNQLPSFDSKNYNFNTLQETGVKKRNNGRIKVVVPKRFEESFEIINDVKQGTTVMVNVEVCNPQVGQRIVDVISGAVYALSGDSKKMGDKQYIFSLSQETIGGFEYLPVNGNMMNNNMYQQQNMGMGFGGQGMPQQPFTFMDFQNQPFSQTQNQPQNQFGNGQQSPNNMNQGYNQNLNQQNFDPRNFYVPPQNQF